MSPQKVANPDKWLHEQVVNNTQPIYPAETETFSGQIEYSEHPYYHQFSSFKDHLNKLSSSKHPLRLRS